MAKGWGKGFGLGRFGLGRGEANGWIVCFILLFALLIVLSALATIVAGTWALYKHWSSFRAACAHMHGFSIFYVALAWLQVIVGWSSYRSKDKGNSKNLGTLMCCAFVCNVGVVAAYTYFFVKREGVCKLFLENSMTTPGDKYAKVLWSSLIIELIYGWLLAGIPFFIIFAVIVMIMFQKAQQDNRSSTVPASTTGASNTDRQGATNLIVIVQQRDDREDTTSRSEAALRDKMAKAEAKKKEAADKAAADKARSASVGAAGAKKGGVNPSKSKPKSSSASGSDASSAAASEDESNASSASGSNASSSAASGS